MNFAAALSRAGRAAAFVLLAVTLSLPLRAEESVTLETLEITARKTDAERWSRPGAVTAYAGGFLAEQGITDYAGLAAVVPGLFVVPQSVDLVSLNLRGLTSDTNDPRVQPQVSVYQDGVALVNSHGNNVALFDLQDVAVYKGPQPTQFARGAQAGALAFTSRRAVDGHATVLAVGAGSRQGASLEATVNRSVIAGRLFARFAVQATRRDGYMTDATSGTDLQGEGTLAWRASLRWQPVAETTADVIFSFQRDDTPGIGTKSMLGVPGLPPVADTDPYRPLRLTRAGELHVNRTILGVTAIVNHRLNERWTLTTTSAAREVTTNNDFDADGTEYYLIEAGEHFQGRQLSQELRFDYDRGGPWTAMVGVAALATKDEQEVIIRSDENLLWRYFTRTPPPVAFNPRYFERNATEAAMVAGDVFGRATYRLAGGLTLGAGLRLTQERLESRFQSFAAMPRGNIVGLLPTSGGPNNLFKETPGQLQHSHQARSWSGQVDVRKEFTPRLAGYVAVSRGRRPPVLDFNELTLAAQTHAEETVLNYEAGFKGAAAGGRFRYEASVFEYHYEHFQTRRIVPPGLFQPYDGGRAHGQGFEVALQADVTRGLAVFATYGYTDARFAERDGEGALQLFAGNMFRLTSRHVVTLGGTVSRTLGGKGTVFISPRYTYRSRHYFEDNNAQNGGILWQGGQGVAHLRLGYRTADERWEIAVQVSNLFDAEYLMDAGNIGGAYGLPTQAAAAPRTVDVKVTREF